MPTSNKKSKTRSRSRSKIRLDQANRKERIQEIDSPIINRNQIMEEINKMIKTMIRMMIRMMIRTMIRMMIKTTKVNKSYINKVKQPKTRGERAKNNSQKQVQEIRIAVSRVNQITRGGQKNRKKAGKIKRMDMN